MEKLISGLLYVGQIHFPSQQLHICCFFFQSLPD